MGVSSPFGSMAWISELKSHLDGSFSTVHTLSALSHYWRGLSLLGSVLILFRFLPLSSRIEKSYFSNSKSKISTLLASGSSFGSWSSLMNGCYRAASTVILFSGSNFSILDTRSIAIGLAYSSLFVNFDDLSLGYIERMNSLAFLLGILAISESEG